MPCENCSRFLSSRFRLTHFCLINNNKNNNKNNDKNNKNNKKNNKKNIKSHRSPVASRKGPAKALSLIGGHPLPERAPDEKKTL